MFASWYQAVPDDLLTQLQNIRVLICDVDGVFSDGRIYLGNQGEELKAFNTKDGFGIKALRQAGIEVGVITGRQSHIVQHRMTALGIPYIYQGQEDKQHAYNSILQALHISPEQASYIGDDTPDLGLIQQSGIGFAPADAHPSVADAADYVTVQLGGFGAVREVCDLLLYAHGQLITHQPGASI